MLELVEERDFETIRIEDVVERAGVDGAEFDRLFDSKEACALAIFDANMASFYGASKEAFEAAPAWPESLRAAGYAAAHWMNEHRRETRFNVVGLMWAGELAQAHRERAFRAFADMIDGGRAAAADPESVPPFTAAAVIGSVVKMVTNRARLAEFEFNDLVPELMYRAVLPYLGEEAARRELTAPPPRALDHG
jgi:AcrR family transcriptional regulator